MKAAPTSRALRHRSGRKAVPITRAPRAIVDDLVIMRWRHARLRAQRIGMLFRGGN